MTSINENEKKTNEIHLRKEHLFQSIDNIVAKFLIIDSENNKIQKNIKQRQSLSNLYINLISISNTLLKIYNFPYYSLNSTIILNFILLYAKNNLISFNPLLVYDLSKGAMKISKQKQLLKIANNTSRLQMEKIRLKRIRSNTISRIKTHKKPLHHLMKKTSKQISSLNKSRNLTIKSNIKRCHHMTYSIYNQTFYYNSPKARIIENNKAKEDNKKILQFKIKKLQVLKKLLNQIKNKTITFLNQ